MITIFSKSYCPYCKSAKDFLDSLGKEYKEVDLEHNPEKMAEIVQISGMMTVPQIFDGPITWENCIGWYTDMIAKYESWEIFTS